MTLHRRSESLTLEGAWWRPGEEDKILLGTLVYEPLIGCRLTVLTFDEGWTERDTGSGPLLGRTVLGQSVTLSEAFVISSSGALFGGGRRGTYHADELLLGCWSDGSEDFRFREAQLYLDGLVNWLAEPWHGRRNREAFLLPGGRSGSGGMRLDGALVSFGLSGTERHERFRQVTEHDASVRIVLDRPATAREWHQDWARRICDLVAFGTDARAEVDALVAVVTVDRAGELHPAIRRAASDQTWKRHEVEVIRRRRAMPLGRPGGHEMLMPASVVAPSNFKQLVKRWFARHMELEGAAAFLFGTLHAEQVPLENRLLNLLSFGETYHRLRFDTRPLSKAAHERARKAMLDVLTDAEKAVYKPRLDYANSQSQRQRIAYLVARAAEVVPEFSTDAKAFVATLIETRNYLTHWSSRSKRVVEGADMLLAVQRFTAVLQTNIMRDLELPEADIAHGVRSSWVTRPGVL